MTISLTVDSSDSKKYQSHLFDGFRLELVYFNTCLESVSFVGKSEIEYPLLPNSKFFISEPSTSFGDYLRPKDKCLIINLDNALFFVNKPEIERFKSVFPSDFFTSLGA